jgi:enamine deaminase RidA (YjgF/YER057c/UK114 family)
MLNIEKKLNDLSLKLPLAPTPAANYLPYIITNKLLFISGQISANENGLIKGVVGQNMSVEEGYIAAQNCGLSLLAHLNVAINGDFQKFKRVIRIAGYVNSTNNFEDHPKVVNGVSDLMVSVFGENGKHMRIALGATLPLGVAVEVEGLFELT